MKHVYGILLSISTCFCQTLCKNNDTDSSFLITDSYFSSDSTKISFKGKYSGYFWDFKRIGLEKLTLIHQKKLQQEFISIRFQSGSIVGLTKDRTKFYFIDTSLNLTNSWGKKGNTSFENTRIFNYEYTKGNIYLFDFQQKSFKKYNIQNNTLSFVYIPSTSRVIYRVCHLSDDKYLYVNVSDSAEGFDFVLTDSTKIVNKISILKSIGVEGNIEYPFMVYDGDFVCDGNDEFVVYFCSSTGLFFCFKKRTGSLLYVIQSIDKTSPPKAKNKEIAKNIFRLELFPNIDFFFDAAISNGKLYLLNFIDPHQQYVADVYNLRQHGEYMGSVFIPKIRTSHRPISIAIYENIFYALYDDQTIAKYKIDTIK